jgi:hypothetical protein
MLKSRRIKWAGNVVRMRKRGIHIEFWFGIQKEIKWEEHISETGSSDGLL